jgi:hypothetical protein
VKTIIWLGLAMIPGIAMAANPPDKQDKKHDAMICRDVGVTGSRLDVKRVCMTKEEWEEARRQARESIEKVQMARAWTAG